MTTCKVLALIRTGYIMADTVCVVNEFTDVLHVVSIHIVHLIVICDTFS